MLIDRALDSHRWAQAFGRNALSRLVSKWSSENRFGPVKVVVLSVKDEDFWWFPNTVAAMPLSVLRDRVVGATYEGCTFNEMLWPLLLRREQALDYVARHSLTNWLAIDDRVDGFESCRHRLVSCQTEVGLGDLAVIELFRQRLRLSF